jgi:hypothetical protein
MLFNRKLHFPEYDTYSFPHNTKDGILQQKTFLAAISSKIFNTTE